MLKITKRILALATAVTLLSGIQLPLKGGAAELTSQAYVLSDNDLQQSDLTYYLNNNDIRLNRLVTGAECYLKESNQGTNLGGYVERLTDGYVTDSNVHSSFGWYAASETTTFIIDLKKAYNISRTDIFIGRNKGSGGADSVDFTVDVKTSNDLKTFTDYSSDTRAYAKDNAMKQIILNPGTVQARYVQVTVEGGPQILLGEIIVFGNEIKDRQYLLSNNTVTIDDVVYYAKNMGMPLEKLYTDATVEVTSTTTDGVTISDEMKARITNGSVESANASVAWGSFNGETATVTFDLKKTYNVGRVDIFLGTHWGLASGAKFSATVKAGDSKDSMTAVAGDTSILFTKVDEVSALSFNTGNIDARYVSVEITSNKQMLLGEVLVFGQEKVSPDGYLLSGNSLRAEDISYYKRNPIGVRLDKKIDTGATFEVVSSTPDPATCTKITDGYLTGFYSDHVMWGKWEGETAVVTFDLQDSYDINRIDLYLGEERTSSEPQGNHRDNIVIKAGNDKDSLTEVKKAENITYTKQYEMRMLPYAIDNVNARYIEITLTSTGHALLGEVMIFGDSAKNKLTRVLENAEEYTNSVPYTESSWNTMTAARTAAQEVFGSESATDEQMKNAANTLDKAIDSMRLRGGDRILSQNDMWESDWGHYTNYDGILREYLPNASAKFLDGTDQNFIDRGTETKAGIDYLFDGYSMGPDGNAGIWSSWGSPGPAIILYDLGEPCYVNGVDVVEWFYYGGKIADNYKVEVSTDGKTYTEVGTKYMQINEDSEGTGLQDYASIYDYLFSSYTFSARKAQYVKITINPVGYYQYALKEVFIRGIKDDTNKILLTKNDNTVSANLTMDGEENAANMLLAVYDKDGRLKNVVSTNDRTLEDGKAILDLNADTAKGDYVKAMAFDSIANMKPILPLSKLARSTETEFTVANIFGDNAVFQRDIDLPVFGRATTGTEIKVTLNEKEYSTQADENGDWIVYADPIAYESGKTYTMTVSAGDETKTFSNMLAGDVWLCSGQSNMFWKVSACDNSEANIKSADNYPNIRYYDMSIVGAETPQDTVGGEWKIPSSQNAGNFSAAAFLTARKLYDDIGVPIGVIAAARGGTSIEGFISREGFANSNIERYYTKLDRSLYFNGMINPIIPYGIKGVLWYQGCQNHAPNAVVYLDEEITLVNDWRSRWGYDMPFIVTELAPCDGSSGFPLIREQQLALRDKLDKIGVVCIMDTGPEYSDRTNVHPTDKDTLAERLALCAEGVAYGMDVEYLFPAPEKCTVNSDGSVTVKYKDVYDGLSVKDNGTISGFELVQGGKVYSASATISGTDTVMVTASGVTAPEEIRYGYTPYPYPALNLYNSAGLIATPFSLTVSK